MSRLEKISKALAGETLTGAARGVGEAIGYVGAGGDFADVPEVLRDAIKEQRKRTELGTQGEKDAYGALQALGLISNPLSQIGAATDFVGALPDLVSAIPERAKAYIAGEPEPVGQIAESGLKRRLAKGGAQAEYAVENQLRRARANLKDKGYKINPYISKILPLSSKGAKWGPGEGKFQVIQDYDTNAFDLNRATNEFIEGMSWEGGSRIISGNPHDLGVQFSNTFGLDPRYRDKGYGKQIYQNMADVYGGGISDSRGTTTDARNVYKSLGAIDTGIPSGGGTRQALPTTAMKNDPAAMAAFEAEVKNYANRAKEDSNRTPQTYIDSAIDNLTSKDRQYLDRELERLAERSFGYAHESEISDLLSKLYSIDLTGLNIPAKLELDRGTWERQPNSAYYRRLP